MGKELAHFFLILKSSVRGFFRDLCFLHASSLTFYTLLSLVPIAAIAFGLAKGFGFESPLEEDLYQRFQDHRQVAVLIVDFSRQLLRQTEGSVIAGVGVIFLFLFVLSMFWTIETSMNNIWKVKRQRKPVRMLTDYLAMMILCPLLFVAASSLLLNISPFVDETAAKIAYSAGALLMIWALFAALYLIMPNRPVSLKYAGPAALLAGTLFSIAQTVMIKFQIGVSSYNAVYGSFAALPIFLLSLQVGWILVLFGAEVACKSEELAPIAASTPERTSVSRSLLSILLVKRLVQHFKRGDPPMSARDFSLEMSLEAPINDQLFSDLKEAGIISEIRSQGGEKAFIPARDPSAITLFSILSAIDKNFNTPIEINDALDIIDTKNALDELLSAAESSSKNISLDKI